MTAFAVPAFGPPQLPDFAAALVALVIGTARAFGLI
jgi:hypothetical protein